MFRGPNTNDMKKQDGPSLSWPTPHTTPFFLPAEDPFAVLLRHNSTQLWEPDPAPARRPSQQQAGTGHVRPERAPGRRILLPCFANAKPLPEAGNNYLGSECAHLPEADKIYIGIHPSTHT
jgi:hypothetical protein